MSSQPDMFATFDGATFNRSRDHDRLASQLQRVERVLRSGAWLTLEQIAKRTGSPQASVSARLRDLRKPKFGGHVIEREFVAGGLHRYRMTA